MNANLLLDIYAENPLIVEREFKPSRSYCGIAARSNETIAFKKAGASALALSFLQKYYLTIA